MTGWGVTFDAGQTLIELDTGLLAARLAERGLTVAPAALTEATTGAWRRYDEVVAAGVAGHPWRTLMDALLAGAGVAEAGRPALVQWLWDEQPRVNLWRREVAGMRGVARRLRAAGVKVAVLSNSEGRLAELFDELGWAGDFDAIIDSGKVGVEKPDARIFALALERLGVAAEHAVHIGDSWPADVAGALAAGWRAIWYLPWERTAERTAGAPAGLDEPRVARAGDASQVVAALARWQVPLATEEEP